MSSQNYKTYESCPACGGTRIELFKKSTFDFRSLKKENLKITDKDYGKIWDLWRCSNCTHLFANPYPSSKFLSSLYEEIEDTLYEQEAESRARNFTPILSFLEKIHPEKGCLFDIGAATGILMKSAREKGWATEGIETSHWAVQTADKKYGIQIINGDFLFTNLKSDHFQAVTMVDFIEHVPHPIECIKKAHEILSEKGILCLVTPDAGSLAAKLIGKKWWHFRPAHLGYFTFHSLASMLNRGGFKLIKTRRYSWTFSAHYLFSRIPIFSILIKNPFLASFWKKIRIKLPLLDSLEIYAEKRK